MPLTPFLCTRDTYATVAPNRRTQPPHPTAAEPLSVAVEISITTYLTYKGGVLSGHCVETQDRTQDSSMLLVGCANFDFMIIWDHFSRPGFSALHRPARAVQCGLQYPTAHCGSMRIGR